MCYLCGRVSFVALDVLEERQKCSQAKRLRHKTHGQMSRTAEVMPAPRVFPLLYFITSTTVVHVLSVKCQTVTEGMHVGR